MNKLRSVLGSLVLVAALMLTGCGSSNAADVASEEMNNLNQQKFPAFTTQTLQGQTVTNKIFANKKITVVNIWGTFCPPCIAEMPELAEWAREMPTDAQLVGLVVDISGADDTRTANEAKKILKKANADFVNLIPCQEMSAYLEDIYGVPTTIFLDAEGNMIAEPVIGADVDSYKRTVENYLHGQR